jgi:outer membrane protein assembly factor BamB
MACVALTALRQLCPAAVEPIESADQLFAARIESEKGQYRLVVENKLKNRTMIAWASSAGSKEDSVEYGKEIPSKLVWAPTSNDTGVHLLAMLTERQRYEDTYDPCAVYVFSAETGTLLWNKTLGRRWDEAIEWSPRSDAMLILTHPVVSEGGTGDTLAVVDSKTAVELARIDVSKLKASGFPNATGIESMQFVADDVIQMRLYQKEGGTTSFTWHFRR